MSTLEQIDVINLSIGDCKEFILEYQESLDKDVFAIILVKLDKYLVYLVDKLHPEKATNMILITGDRDSTLSRLADVVLWTGAPKEICPLGLTPTTSTTVMSVMGDILVSMMMEKINFTPEEYYKRHHGGYLGQKAKEKIK